MTSRGRMRVDVSLYWAGEYVSQSDWRYTLLNFDAHPVKL